MGYGYVCVPWRGCAGMHATTLEAAPTPPPTRVKHPHEHVTHEPCCGGHVHHARHVPAGLVLFAGCMHVTTRAVLLSACLRALMHSTCIIIPMKQHLTVGLVSSGAHASAHAVSYAGATNACHMSSALYACIRRHRVSPRADATPYQ